MPDDDAPDWSWFHNPAGPSERRDPAATGPAAPFVPGPPPSGPSSLFQQPAGEVAGGQGPVTAPSKLFLWAAAALAVVALILIPVAMQAPLVGLVGWLLGGFLAVGLVSLWSYQEAQARTSLWYLEV